MVAMVKSVIDRVEQAQLTELFIALASSVPAGSRLAESVTFGATSSSIGIEPSPLPELLAVLDEAAGLSTLGDELRGNVQQWRPVLEARVRLAEPRRTPSADGHMSVPGPRSSVEPDGQRGNRDH
jgi:hypothetical protein